MEKKKGLYSKDRIKIIGIYMITSPSGKIYIGQTIDIDFRWYYYDGLKCKRQTKLLNSFLKYGVDNHQFEILCECEELDLEYLETAFIEFFDTFNTPYGMNLTKGGKHGKRSDETRKKISEANKGKKRSPEQIIKMRNASLGNKNFEGKHHSEETKKKISEAHNGKKLTEEHKMKLSKSGKGRKKSEDHKKKISEAHKEWWKNNHRVPSEEQKRKYSETIKAYWGNITDEELKERYKNVRGKKHSEETKKKMSESKKKYWETAERKPDSEETRRKKGEASKKAWEEKRDEIIAAQKGKKRTEEQKVNYKKGALKRWENIPKEDRKLSEDHKKKIGKASEGNQYALGYKHTDETKAKISETSKVNSKKYWDELKKDEKAYNEVCKRNKEAQLKYWEEKIKASGLTMEEYENIRKEKRKEQKKRAYATWLEKNRNTEEYKRKQNEKGMRSYYKNRDRITEMRKSKRQLEKERIRQEKLTMVF